MLTTVSTLEASSILGVSRNWLNKLAERGDIPSTLEPGHGHGGKVRRIAVRDLVRYAEMRASR